MNSVFKELATRYAAGTGRTLSHKQVVTRLYRDALRTSASWYIDREAWLNVAGEVRARFDAHKDLPVDSGLTKRLVHEAQAELASWTHPDPYTVAYMPGGSKFMRNPAVPLKAIYPEGIPDEVNIASQDVHGIQVPMSAQPEGMDTVLIDIYRKRAL